MHEMSRSFWPSVVQGIILLAISGATYVMWITGTQQSATMADIKNLERRADEQANNIKGIWDYLRSHDNSPSRK
jgi:hypothetical protein